MFWLSVEPALIPNWHSCRIITWLCSSASTERNRKFHVMSQPWQQGCLLSWRLIVFSCTTCLLSSCPSMFRSDYITTWTPPSFAIWIEQANNALLTSCVFYVGYEIDSRSCQNHLMARNCKATHLLQNRPNFFVWSFTLMCSHEYINTFAFVLLTLVLHLLKSEWMVY